MYDICVNFNSASMKLCRHYEMRYLNSLFTPARKLVDLFGCAASSSLTFPETFSHTDWTVTTSRGYVVPHWKKALSLPRSRVMDYVTLVAFPSRLLNKAVRQSPDLLFIATSFWFEESPCAVRTNTAGLDRLCTLFVWSTLVVFEHTHAVLSSTLVLCCTMVTTSTAAMCNSRYADTDRMKIVFLIRFSKPHLDRTKAGRCTNACRREGFTIASIKKDTYMCSLNCVGNIVFTLNHVHCNLSIVHG